MIRSLLRVGLIPSTVVAVAAGVAVAALASPLADLIGSPEEADALTSYLRILGAAAPAGAILYAVLGATRGFSTMRPTVVANDLLRPSGQLALVGLAVLLAPTPTWLGLGYGVPVGIALLVAAFWLRGLLRANAPTVGARLRPPWAEFWTFSLPRSASGVFAVVLSWLDVLLLGALASTAAAGVYAALSRYLVVGTTLQSALTRAFQPQMTQALTVDDREAAGRLFRAATGWSMMLTWPAYVVMIVHAPELLRVFGEDYVAGRAAMVILAVAWLVGTALGPVDAVLVLSGRSSLSMMNLGLALTVNISLNLVLIPRLGITGAAWAWLASILTHNLLPTAQVWSSLGLHAMGRHTLRIAILSVACFGGVGAAAKAWLSSGLLTVLVALVVGCGLYTAGLYWWRDALDLPALFRALRRRRATDTDTETM